MHYSDAELQALGFESVGVNVRISKKASFYGVSRIRIGDHVRIDDFCVLSAGEGGIVFGDYIHMAVYSSIIGAGRVQIGSYANISSRVSIYSSSDDYSGEFMTNPMVPSEYTNVHHAPVTIQQHVIVGSGAVILPGVELGEGCAVGALSLVNRSLAPFTINAGQPAKTIKARATNLLDLQLQFEKSQNSEK